MDIILFWSIGWTLFLLIILSGNIGCGSDYDEYLVSCYKSVLRADKKISKLSIKKEEYLKNDDFIKVKKIEKRIKKIEVRKALDEFRIAPYKIRIEIYKLKHPIKYFFIL